jgi:hypothetical protein
MDWTGPAEELEELLAALLYDEGARRRLVASGGWTSLRAGELEEAAQQVRRMVLARCHRGTGGLATWFPETLAAWRSAHPDDATLDDLAAAFCASPACAAWRESATATPGISLEEAFYRFFTAATVGDPLARQDEFLGALLRGLAVTPGARFRHPAAVRPAPGGFFAVSDGGTLHAAIDGRYLRGQLPEVARRLLSGDSREATARHVGWHPSNVTRVEEELRRLRLLP